MDSEVFQRFCTHAHEQAGISLGPNKEALVAARVGKRMHALSLPNERSYLDYLGRHHGRRADPVPGRHLHQSHRLLSRA